MPVREDLVRRGRDWAVTNLVDFSKGVDYRTNPTQLDEGVCSEIVNMYLSPKGLVTDTGEAKIGATVRGASRGAFEHETVIGVRTLILVTDDTVYQWMTAPEAWHYVSDGVDTTLTADANPTDTVLTVAAIAGFSDGDYIGITLDSGGEHQTTINGVPAGNSITITDAMPSIASSGKIVVKAKDLSGTSSYAVVFAAVPWEEWTILTNGVDPPQRYDGDTVEDIPNLPSGGNTVCRTLDVFKSHIFLGNMTEGGTRLPYNVRWSDTRDGTNWSTGNASYNALTDTRDPVVAFKKLSNYFIIYHSKSITRVSYLGALNEMFLWQAVNFGQSIKFEGVGAGSPNSVYATEDEHVVLNSKGIYIYGGGGSIEPVSGPLEPKVFGAQGWFDTTKESTAFVTEFERRRWLLFFIPTSLSTYPDRAVVYDISHKVWVGLRAFSFEATFSAPRIGGSAVRYVDLVGTMAQQTWSASSALTTGRTLSSILGSDLGNVYEYDYLQTTHGKSGANVTGAIETKLFTGMDRPFRVKWVEVEYSGQVYVLIGSDDVGWTLLGLLPAVGASLTRKRVTVDATLGEMQVRCLTLGTGNIIRSIAAKTREAARWSI